MLDYGGGGPDSAKIGECKPDYEQMIKRSKTRLVKTELFIAAIFDYTGNTRLRDKMAELVGELVSEERQLKNEIESLISQQEKA